LGQGQALSKLMETPGHGYMTRLSSGEVRVLKTREGRIEEFFWR